MQEKKEKIPIKREVELIESPRIPGLHFGNAWISDDFDESLSDEFWLGQQNTNNEIISK